jgi:hypothetical protein
MAARGSAVAGEQQPRQRPPHAEPSAAAGATSASTLEALLSTCLTHERAGNPSAAADTLEAALVASDVSSSSCWRLRCRLARLRLAAGDAPAAVRHWRLAADTCPPGHAEKAEALALAGAALAQAGDAAGAAVACESALLAARAVVAAEGAAAATANAAARSAALNLALCAQALGDGRRARRAVRRLVACSSADGDEEEEEEQELCRLVLSLSPRLLLPMARSTPPSRLDALAWCERQARKAGRVNLPERLRLTRATLPLVLPSLGGRRASRRSVCETAAVAAAVSDDASHHQRSEDQDDSVLSLMRSGDPYRAEKAIVAAARLGPSPPTAASLMSSAREAGGDPRGARRAAEALAARWGLEAGAGEGGGDADAGLLCRLARLAAREFEEEEGRRQRQQRGGGGSSEARALAEQAAAGGSAAAACWVARRVVAAVEAADMPTAPASAAVQRHYWSCDEGDQGRRRQLGAALAAAVLRSRAGDGRGAAAWLRRALSRSLPAAIAEEVEEGQGGRLWVAGAIGRALVAAGRPEAEAQRWRRVIARASGGGDADEASGAGLPLLLPSLLWQLHDDGDDKLGPYAGEHEEGEAFPPASVPRPPPSPPPSPSSLPGPASRRQAPVYGSTIPLPSPPPPPPRSQAAVVVAKKPLESARRVECEKQQKQQERRTEGAAPPPLAPDKAEEEEEDKEEEEEEDEGWDHCGLEDLMPL